MSILYTKLERFGEEGKRIFLRQLSIFPDYPYFLLHIYTHTPQLTSPFAKLIAVTAIFINLPANVVCHKESPSHGKRR